MALPFDLTEDATADLEAAAAYLAERSEAAALKLADDLENAFLLIAQHPRLGRVRVEYSALEDLRFWTSAGYRMPISPTDLRSSSSPFRTERVTPHPSSPIA